MSEYTQEYLLEEYHAFRKIMCSTEYTIEQKQNAYYGLMWVYLHASLICDESTMIMMDTLEIEFSRRIAYEIVQPLRKLCHG